MMRVLICIQSMVSQLAGPRSFDKVVNKASSSRRLAASGLVAIFKFVNINVDRYRSTVAMQA